MLFACLVCPQGAGGALLELAQAFSPRYQRHGDEAVSLDVSGLGRMFGDARAIGEAIRHDAGVRGLSVQVAIAGTRTAARLLAVSRPGLTVIAPGGEAAALAGLPIRLAEMGAPAAMPSRGGEGRGEASASVRAGGGAPALLKNADQSAEVTRAMFAAWGLRTLGELAALPAADLAARLGPGARLWQAMARGEDVYPLVPEAPEERFDATLDLEWPIEGLTPLSFVLTRLLEPIATRLERRDRAVAVLHVRLDLVGHDIVTRSLHLPLPVRDVRTLRTLALLDLESVTLGAPVERITIAVDPTPGKVLQHALFERAQPAPEQIATLVARLGALMGQDRVGAAATVDTYRPGAFTMHTFAPAAPAAMRARGERLRPVSSANARGAASGGGASRAVVSAGPRAGIGVGSRRGWGSGATGHADSRVSKPLVVETSLPDGFPGVLRRCRRPVPARVAFAEGRPVRVDGDRQSFAGGAVRQAAGPWRVSGEWWITRQAYPTHAAPFDRVEWDVALADGAVFRIFQEQTTGRWFIDGGMD